MHIMQMVPLTTLHKFVLLFTKTFTISFDIILKMIESQTSPSVYSSTVLVPALITPDEILSSIFFLFPISTLSLLDVFIICVPDRIDAAIWFKFLFGIEFATAPHYSNYGFLASLDLSSWCRQPNYN